MDRIEGGVERALRHTVVQVLLGASLALAVLTASAVRGRAAVPYGPAVTIRLTEVATGYIAARLAGPPGASLELSEVRGTRVTMIRRVELPASGQAVVPRLLTWLCRPRARIVSVGANPDGEPLATATIVSPSCAGRLRTRIPGRGTVGTRAHVVLHDRWRLGDLVATLCVTPPGGRASCSHAALGSAGRRTVPVALPRPGGWRISVGTGFGRPQRRLVWAAHRGGGIRLLAAGDSEMQILDDFIGQDLRARHVRVQSDARISTGLTNSFFFDWQREARARAASFAPDVSVVFMGANDGFSVAGPAGASVGCCGAPWSRGYAKLVAEMMHSLLRRDAGRVYWCVLPAPRPANFRSLFDAVNAGIRDAARRFPGRVGLIDTNAIFTPGNRYRDYMTYGGRGFVIHEPDGIHLSTASDTIVAQLVERRLLADRVIR